MKVGEHTYFGRDFEAREFEPDILTIGKYCSIADCVLILCGGEHDTNKISTFPFHIQLGVGSEIKHTHKGTIEIGNDVWIGSHVIILSGVKIGDGACIGAGSIVTKDIPPYAVAAGNPARVIRMRFSDEDIEKLLKVKWWDWDTNKVMAMINLIDSDDIDALVAGAEL